MIRPALVADGVGGRLDFWPVVPFLGALVGDLYTGVNPWRTLSQWLAIGDPESRQPEVGRRLGWWPATVILVVVAWLELVYPGSADPATLPVVAIVFSLFLLTMIGRFGREAALTSFDPFTSYNRLISAISPFGRNDKGRLVYRGWLRSQYAMLLLMVLLTTLGLFILAG